MKSKVIERSEDNDLRRALKNSQRSTRSTERQQLRTIVKNQKQAINVSDDDLGEEDQSTVFPESSS